MILSRSWSRRMDNKKQEKELQTLLLQIRSYQNVLQELSREVAIIERAISEAETAVKAVSQLPDAGDQSEAFVPLGSGVYTKSKIIDPSKFLVSVGAGISIEKTTEETVDYLKKRISEMGKEKKRMSDQIQRVITELDSMNKRAEAIYSKLQK